jgi:hypothetical protein
MEIRVDAEYQGIAEVDAFFGEIATEASKVPPSQRVVTVTDWRRCPAMSDVVAEHLMVKIIRTNPRTERSAALASRDSALASLQFLRVVRESQNPSRRLFFDPEELVTWLVPVLTSAELERHRRFVLE